MKFNGMRNVGGNLIVTSCYKFYKQEELRHFLYEAVYHDSTKKNANKGKFGEISPPYMMILVDQGFVCLAPNKYWESIKPFLISDKMLEGLAIKWNEEFDQKITANDVNRKIKKAYEKWKKTEECSQVPRFFKQKRGRLDRKKLDDLFGSKLHKLDYDCTTNLFHTLFEIRKHTKDS